jgi:O-acetylhomoserine/O-acetylserine sulfhydrylase-like pyridoxal-dependent enzyme
MNDPGHLPYKRPHQLQAELQDRSRILLQRHSLAREKAALINMLEIQTEISKVLREIKEGKERDDKLCQELKLQLHESAVGDLRKAAEAAEHLLR